MLVGGSSTGKTRACWEALELLRDLPERWRLWHPIDPSRPEAALRDLLRIGPRTVVWLNEAQFYLDGADGIGERVAAGLREVLRDPAKAPVLVLATLWPEYWDQLTARPQAGTADPHAQTRELLTGQDIAVPTAFTADQLRHLAMVHDPRLELAADAAEDGRIIQFLAGAPELTARYRNAPPAAAALIDAAIDARRLGMGVALSRSFLEAAASGYLTDADWDAMGEDWAEQGFAYAAVPCKGARGPLTRMRPRLVQSSRGGTVQEDGDQPDVAGGTSVGPIYRLADYLDQYGRAHRREEIPPSEFWAAAAAYAVPADQAALGEAAWGRGHFRAASQLNKNAAVSGNPRAARFLAYRPQCLAGDSRPSLWAATHTSIEEPGTVADLMGNLRRFGARDQLTTLADRAAAHTSLGDWLDVIRSLAQLREAEAREHLVILADRAVAGIPLDDPHAVAMLLEELWEAGAQEQVAALLARDPAAHVAIHRPDWVDKLLLILRRAGGTEQAAALVDRISALAGQAAINIPLDAPGEIAGLVQALHELSAHEQIAALLARDPATRVTVEDPAAVAKLIRAADRARFRMPKTQQQVVVQQVTTLASRAAGNVSLHETAGLAEFIHVLDHISWTREQLTILLDRDPGSHAAIDDPGAVASLLSELPWGDRGEQGVRLFDRYQYLLISA
ncbi:MAG: hypothetical protein ACHP9Z_20995 [Streptosporangiales bacterium]